MKKLGVFVVSKILDKVTALYLGLAVGQGKDLLYILPICCILFAISWYFQYIHRDIKE